MKTYCERAQDILRRLEIYEKQKQKRQKRLYMGLALAACLAVAVCAAAVLPPSFIGRNGRPRRILQLPPGLRPRYTAACHTASGEFRSGSTPRLCHPGKCVF